MNSYLPTPSLMETWNNTYTGSYKKELNLDRLEQFKAAVEHHITGLTLQVQTLTTHTNWIEPRLHDFIKFNQWMEQAHPDIIEAYKKSTAVAEKLDRANDTTQPQVSMGAA